MSDLDIKAREGYSDTMKALEYAADGGLIEESEIDRDFYTLTREKGTFKDGYEAAVVDFLKSIQEGKRSVCVTEGALTALGVQTDSPKDYCPAPTTPAPAVAPAPAAPEPSPPPPPPAPEIAPAPLRPLPPLFRDWLSGRSAAPVVTPTPAPAVTPAPPAVIPPPVELPKPAAPVVAPAPATIPAPGEKKADLSKAIKLSDLSSTIRSGRTLQIDLRKKTIRGAEGEEFFPEGTAEGYIPGADPERVFMALVHLETGTQKMSDGRPMIPDWVDTRVENRPADYRERLQRGENIPMTHTLWMEIPPTLKIQSTVNYWRIRNNLNGTYELRWRETTLRHSRAGYDPLAKNQGGWVIKAVVDDSGRVVGTYIQYALWTDPAETASFRKKEGGNDSDKWRLGKGAFKTMSALKIPWTFDHIAEVVGAKARFSARVSCTAELRSDPVWSAMEICK